jgi:CBS domain-containing protein
MVMGSEGRGEQTVRTDQDNGLLLAAPVSLQELQAFRAVFSEALERFGFPPCPGNAWSQTLEGLIRQIRSSVMTPGRGRSQAGLHGPMRSQQVAN